MATLWTGFRARRWPRNPMRKMAAKKRKTHKNKNPLLRLLRFLAAIPLGPVPPGRLIPPPTPAFACSIFALVAACRAAPLSLGAFLSVLVSAAADAFLPHSLWCYGQSQSNPVKVNQTSWGKAEG